MNKFTIIMIAILCMSYQTNLNETTTTDEPYELSLQIKKIKNNTYNLTITMELEKEAHFVSPHSKGDYKGRFVMLLEKNTKVTTNGTLLESPKAEEKIDPWTGNLASLVKGNTVYTQQLTITDTNDFEVSGFIQFVIEPRCTMEKINFTISRRAGKLDIKKVKQ